MATIKNYTDISQSEVLAKILSLESADMHYSKDFDGSWFVDLAQYSSVKVPKYVVNVEEHLLPCWSIASLLSVLPRYIEFESNLTFLSIYRTKYLGWAVEYSNTEDDFVELTFVHQQIVNACYEMIIHLHELKKL